MVEDPGGHGEVLHDQGPGPGDAGHGMGGQVEGCLPGRAIRQGQGGRAEQIHRPQGQTGPGLPGPPVPGLDLMALGQEPGNQGLPDETGGSDDQDFHTGNSPLSGCLKLTGYFEEERALVRASSSPG